MTDIGITDFYIGVPSLPREEFEEYSMRIFDEWENYVENTLVLPDYSLALDVEEGSIKAVGRVAATLGALYIGIGQYGSFVSGLQAIQSQVRTVGDYLGERAAAPFESSNAAPKVRKRGESLTRLKKLFIKVERGEITVEEAMQESKDIFGAEAETASDFMNELKVSLEKTPLLPQQIQLQLESLEQEELMPVSNKRKTPRLIQPKKPMPRPQQFRVEVWRETKKGKRNVRVVKL